jgi:hypothetical protein
MTIGPAPLLPQASDDTFVCGNMKRSVDIFSASGGPPAQLTSEFLTAVPTQNAVHPTLRAIVSGTASGRCYMWR